MLAEVIVHGVYLCGINGPNGRWHPALGPVGSNWAELVYQDLSSWEILSLKSVFTRRDLREYPTRPGSKVSTSFPDSPSHKENSFPQLSKLMLSLWQLNR